MTNSAPVSGLYTGVINHKRFAPKPHALRYRIFMALLDIDELDGLSKRLRFFSHNRFNLLAFHDSDHLPKDALGGGKLRSLVEGRLQAMGLVPDGGAIRLLTMPRVLGFAFNPLTVYFCYARDGSLVAIFYEVNNTFGQRHTYAIPVERDARGPIHQRCLKTFYVSPFFDLDMTYDFRVVPPEERVSVAVDGTKGGARMIAASFAGARRALSDGQILNCVFRHPLLALKVLAGIHWEALVIWLKGIGLQERPAPPEHPVTFVMRKEV